MDTFGKATYRYKLLSGIVVANNPLVLPAPFADDEFGLFHVVMVGPVSTATTVYLKADQDMKNDPLTPSGAFTTAATNQLEGVLLPTGTQPYYCDIPIEAQRFISIAVIGTTPPAAFLCGYWERSAVPTQIPVLSVDPPFPDQNPAAQYFRGQRQREALERTEKNGTPETGNTPKINRYQR